MKHPGDTLLGLPIKVDVPEDVLLDSIRKSSNDSTESILKGFSQEAKDLLKKCARAEIEWMSDGSTYIIDYLKSKSKENK
jgi:hypothetical protein